ncbi:unnamed protein product [Ceratitis capitata]|uniref:(Mediterranean fruit fly) hypothetical protein n=1 Tax=Ceratitis capitata TaxID=7213 RepID=A0A811UAI5_CERCA|nr:unnamed protein product [Ceratitis capitata]
MLSRKVVKEFPHEHGGPITYEKGGFYRRDSAWSYLILFLKEISENTTKSGNVAKRHGSMDPKLNPEESEPHTFISIPQQPKMIGFEA